MLSQRVDVQSLLIVYHIYIAKHSTAGLNGNDQPRVVILILPNDTQRCYEKEKKHDGVNDKT